MRATTRSTAPAGRVAPTPASGVPERLSVSSPSSWKARAAVAMRNSITPGMGSAPRRITSSVRPTRRPSRKTGSQLVTPCTRPAASTASSIRTSGSSSSRRPPSVKPISGSAFASAQSPLRASTAARRSSGRPR
ncbi:hypothetical protein BC477_07040 [Clavibacter michiganensis subsp. michiganensis]|uniref:Uncharacterized protein n=1 Tax=Clavibacter michiganensis subsp. michiganensis TaxID=33013 RepID=A0A251XLW2_CLAMM|nr:hypothetical protein BC477_07040 [Clavibacter michiganensis subsp. michiganensis]OUE04472.1 hypothetical protein CMMCAS07_05970 [Clavibacter michiganensis subsp. michiganensis]